MSHHACKLIMVATVLQEIIKGENLHEFRDFTATRESFLHDILGMPHPLCDQFHTL